MAVPPPPGVFGVMVYGHTTTAMHDIEYISPIEYTSPPLVCCTAKLFTFNRNSRDEPGPALPKSKKMKERPQQEDEEQQEQEQQPRQLQEQQKQQQEPAQSQA